MFANRLLATMVLMLAGAVAAATAGTARDGIGTFVRGEHASMTMITTSPRTLTPTRTNDAGLVTIFSNLASKYPKGEYWCCTGYNVMGSQSGNGEQWMAAAFTPTADHTVTKIEVGAGWSQGTNGIVVSLNKDSNGAPGAALKTWNVSNLGIFGTCCALVVKSDKSGIPVSAGKQYWVVLSTNGNELDTVDAWNVDDTDQVDSATLASFTGSQWNVFQVSPGVAFAVKGN
ncbi:MAG TPA: choice-of-anchor R domain-containing protein [Rhizomicrobium sp.]|jgi:hypothetical protein